MKLIPTLFSATDQIKDLLRAFKVYVGTTRTDFKVSVPMPRKRSAAVCIVWDQLMLAAKSIAAIENPENVLLVSSRPYGYHAGLKFAQYAGCRCHCVTGRLTLGTFSNLCIQQNKEPKLLIITDPFDAEVIKEATSSDIPLIILSESDSPLKYADCVASDTKKSRDSRLSIAFLYWLLAREVICLRNKGFKSTSNMAYTEFIDEFTVSPALKSAQREETIPGLHLQSAAAEARATAASEKNAALMAKIDGLKVKLDLIKANVQIRKSVIAAANKREYEANKDYLSGATSARRTVVTFADEKHGWSQKRDSLLISHVVLILSSFFCRFFC